MGAWGYKNFENDTALDWLSEFSENPDITNIEEIFNYILEQEEFLDSDGSSIGLACAEFILSQLKLDYQDNIPSGYDLENIKLNVSKEVVKDAIVSIEKILYFDEHSELRELWEESDDYDNWLQEQKKLSEALKVYL